MMEDRWGFHCRIKIGSGFSKLTPLPGLVRPSCASLAFDQKVGVSSVPADEFCPQNLTERLYLGAAKNRLRPCSFRKGAAAPAEEKAAELGKTTIRPTSGGN